MSKKFKKVISDAVTVADKISVVTSTLGTIDYNAPSPSLEIPIRER